MKKPLQSKPAARKAPAKQSKPLCSKTARNGNSAPAIAKSAINVSALAREYGISRETLRNWNQIEDLDLTDRKAIKARVESMRSKAPTDLAAAKLEKILLESQRIQHALEVEKGRFVAIDAIYQDGRNIGKLVQDTFNKAVSELPPQLGGQDSEAIHKILKAYFRESLTNLSRYQSAIEL